MPPLFLRGARVAVVLFEFGRGLRVRGVGGLTRGDELGRALVDPANLEVGFDFAGGQTIGKMATHIRVVGDDGRAVDVSGAALRTAGNAIQIVTLGLAWLPALLAADGRGIADRIAGTRVVRA